MLDSVRAVLEVHLGESLSSPGLGVVEFAEVVHHAGGGAQALAGSVRAALLRHEPRLRGVVVRPVEAEPLCLAFEVTGQVVGRGEMVHVLVELSAAGQLRVRG